MSAPLPRETRSFDTAHIGRRVLVYDAVESTNTLGAALGAADPEASGLVLIADHQLAGRGQYGRTWVSRPGSSLLMSVVLRPPPAIRRPVVLTAWVAVAVADAVFALSGAQARIKWPNDLLIDGKKICGILIEQTSSGDGTIAVAGLGLNLTQTAADFAHANLLTATSLHAVSGGSYDPRGAAEVVVGALDREYARLLAGERAGVEAGWKRRIGLLGRAVRVELVGGAWTTGRLLDVSFDGLELEDAAGFVRVVPPESVSHLWPV
ncbi:Bifunctional ligase/repressor BirA [Gemmata obscuriglobus]|uniref:Biotin--[acetyl-CoA-carboxylase] ligase n=1 Tax=Gemmata obscuriglobus TaxID=114 RepID=A0A2Z3H1L9_9BACT|nr:biotin--[acetyl-CoA-carboxylase] ligase [Gemmata obscuriglobus]AWM38232.1 biotin--[acetyl-CoA-carboxylase] ligase [Gemmata obscuriglobus]QEG28864.1 Bifunctional ligase/repressor BirA [Gemmata obscuriglobus]